jgi:murein DD-endopeptidase MepM/ murein hydrolase activator NlpD
MKSAPRQSIRRGSSRFRTTVGATIVTLSLIAFGGIAATPAYADEYPTWDDVTAAQANETSKQAEVSRIQGLIDGLKSETAAAQLLSQQRGEAYQLAQAQYDTANYKAGELKAQADAAQSKADSSIKQAGQLAALMAKSGGSGLSVSLLTSESSDADSLLYQLGAMSQLTGSTSKVYQQAEQDKNTAQSLTDQATVAADELLGLAAEAERLRDAAIQSQVALEASLANQQNHEVDLQAQLKVLTENRAATMADYQAGVAARAAAEAKRAEEARAAAAAAAAAGLPQPSSEGWTSPLPGSYSSDEYGMRVNPVDGGYRLHAGIDLVYNSGTCGAAVYAAAAGTVTFSGYNGGFGNNVQINNGGGVSTSYAHNTVVLTEVGQWVDAGQLISYAGTTGNSTGCHVHFEIRVNGSTTNPRTFMEEHGVDLG